MPGRDERRRENLAGELVPVIRQVAHERGANLVDLHAAADLQDPALYPDRVHLDTRGYALVARHVAAAIRGLMDEDAR